MRFNVGVGALTAMMLSGGPELIPNFDQPHEHGRRRNKPSGSKPVAGGGARERARRLAKMQAGDVDAQSGTADDRLPGSADDWRNELRQQ